MKNLKHIILITIVCYGQLVIALGSAEVRRMVKQAKNPKTPIATIKKNLNMLEAGHHEAAAREIRSIFARRAPLIFSLNPETTAVLIIDIQDDFTVPNSYKKNPKKLGSLAVQESGNEYVSRAISVTKALKQNGYEIFASQDYHPANHMSFASNHRGKKPFQTLETTIPTKSGGRKNITQVLWPDHCVQGSDGADILIPRNLLDTVIKKGTHPDCDSYSAFEDDSGQETGLNDMLNKEGIKTIIIYGIATDYCVKFSVIDALKAGKQVYLVTDLCRGVDPDGSQQAIGDMQMKGANLITSAQLLEIMN